jgi:hypothetical protein
VSDGVFQQDTVAADQFTCISDGCVHADRGHQRGCR